MKIRRVFESIDMEDFDIIFQDIKDDFPHIQWRFDRKGIESILKGENDISNLDGVGMKLYNPKKNYPTFVPNLIGHSNDLPYNHQDMAWNGVRYNRGLRKIKNEIAPYLVEIKNRLKESEITVGIYVRIFKNTWGVPSVFNFTIMYKPNKTSSVLK